MIWLLLTAVLAVVVWYKFVRPLNYFNRKGVEQTNPIPLFGDQFKTMCRLQNVSDNLQGAYNKFRNLRYFGYYQFGCVPTLVLNDIELIKQLTIKDFDHFSDHRGFADPDVEPLWSNNLFSLKGQKWREMRATLSQAFTSSKMKQMFNIMNGAAENFVHFFLNKNDDVVELELKDTYTRYTNDVIATTAFGIKVDSLAEPDNAFYNMGATVTNFSGFLTTLKFSLAIFLPKLFKLLKVGIFSKEVTSYFRDIIHETIETRQKDAIVRQDMINILMEAKKGAKQDETETNRCSETAIESNDLHKFKQIRALSNDDITSQALIFFFAGFDTISTGLCFASYELAVNKDVQDKLRKEIQETHKTVNGELTYDALQKMKYLDCVISEALRKWPPVMALNRICTKPYTIEPVLPKETPVHLQVGDEVWLPVHAIQRNADFYPDPDKFDPARFSDENKDHIVPYTYLSFGVGPRNCIGSRFALLECKALLYNLLLNFEIVPTKKTSIPLRLSKKSFNPSAEGGFWLGFKRIKQ